MACANKLGFLTRSISSSSTLQCMVKPPIKVFGIEGRYVNALYSAASKQKSLKDVEKDLTSFQQELKKNDGLRELLYDPTIKHHVKASALKSAATEVNYSAATGFFLEVVAENGRLKLLDAIINAFKLMMSAHRGEVICEVITAKPLDKCQTQILEDELRKFVNDRQTIKLTAKLNPDIIGGMVVSIGDKSVDLSVSTKIKKYTELISTPV